MDREPMVDLICSKTRISFPTITAPPFNTLFVFTAAFFAKLPVLNSWWCLDDWGQLGRAAGILGLETNIPARWLSQQLYWAATWPIFGMATIPYAFSRIILHCASSVMVSRISSKAGLGSTASLISGLIFAASPISFTALYWASGVQELLGGLFALLAIDRWLVGKRRSSIFAIIFGIGSLLSKENALGLPLFMMVILYWTRYRNPVPNSLRWSLAIFLTLFAVFESLLVWRDFPTGLHESYRIGGFFVVLGNVGKFGWWLLTQGPIFTGQVDWNLATIGLVFWVSWASWALINLRRGTVLPIATILASVLSIAPATVLVFQARPYMGYLAMACLAISIGCLWPRKWKPGVPVKMALFVAAVLWGLWGMHSRIENISQDGFPADPIVRAMDKTKYWSHFIQDTLLKSASKNTSHVVILQLPLRAEDIDRARQLGADYVLETDLHKFIGGAAGLALTTGKKTGALWVNSLMNVPADAFVFCQTEIGLKPWGDTRDALIYASLLDILVGNFQRAYSQLELAASIDHRFDLFELDPETIPIPREIFQKQSKRFIQTFPNNSETEWGIGASATANDSLFNDFLSRMGDIE